MHRIIAVLIVAALTTLGLTLAAEPATSAGGGGGCTVKGCGARHNGGGGGNGGGNGGTGAGATPLGTARGGGCVTSVSAMSGSGSSTQCADCSAAPGLCPQTALGQPGGAVVPVLINPTGLAQRAYRQLSLVTPSIKMAPQPPLETYVGLETWLWAERGDWSTRRISVSAGPITVSMSAVPVGLDWDLTEGSTYCNSVGRPWVKGMSSSATTSCSYTFSTMSRDEPEGKYAVSAGIVYHITWRCNGLCSINGGDFGNVAGPTAATAIEVSERQSVVKRNS